MIAATFALLSIAAASAGAASTRRQEPAAPRCRAIPGSEDWPSEEKWASLNGTVGGRLLKPAPPGAACHETQPTFDVDQCATVQQTWSSEWFHSEDPLSVEWNNWTNDTCLPIASAPCSSSGYPAYVIDAMTPKDVKAGIDFARENNVRLIVKNSGHDFIGRSVGANSLSIWVHHMKGVTIHEESFSPDGCDVEIKGAAMTIRGGSQMTEIYSAADGFGHVPIGANGRSVAIGGFITGAGHSIISPQYGLAADHVLEMEVVSPSGEILTLNECQNTDLFWALRGGGASTFGVVTSVTMTVFPSPTVVSLNFFLVGDANNPNAFDMLAYLLSQFPALQDAGISGYPLIIRNTTGAAPGVRITGLVGKFIMLNTQDPADLMAHLDPIRNHINETWAGFQFFGETTPFPSFYAWYEENFDPSPAGYDNLLASRLLDEESLTGNLTAVKGALERFAGGDQNTVFLVSGKGVWEAEPRGGGNAVVPAWRKAVVHATVSLRFGWLDAQAKQDALARTNDMVEGLKELNPDSGAYLNEAGPEQPNWRHEFWGENYERLLKIKREVDPDDVLWCTPCVGNERWEEIDGQLCRIQGEGEAGEEANDGSEDEQVNEDE